MYRKNIYELTPYQLMLIRKEFDENIQLLRNQQILCSKNNDADEYAKCVNLEEAYDTFLGIAEYWSARKYVK